MKKKHPVLLGFIIIIVIMLGWKVSEKPREIAYLKRHEKEMTKYIKSQKSEVKNVQYYWEDIRIGDIGNGLPWGGGKRALIFGFVNSDIESDFRLDIDIDGKGVPIMSSIHFGQSVDW